LAVSIEKFAKNHDGVTQESQRLGCETPL
jgi:hypothetical protein